MSNSKQMRESFEVGDGEEMVYSWRAAYDRVRYIPRPGRSRRGVHHTFGRGGPREEQAWRDGPSVGRGFKGRDNFLGVFYMGELMNETASVGGGGASAAGTSKEPVTMEHGGPVTGMSNVNRPGDVPVRMCGRQPPPALGYTFLRTALRDEVLQNVRREQYTWPTPIQRYAIPVALSGRDMLACAQSGSGKSVAMVLPLISRVLSLDLLEMGTPNPYVLIVVPDREPAYHVHRLARIFTRGTLVRVLMLCPGSSVDYQQYLLNAGCHMVVGTLDRINYFLMNGSLSLRNLRTLAVTDTDRLIDMGQKPLLEQLLWTPGMARKERRQTLMYTSGMSLAVHLLADTLLHDPVSVCVDIMGSALAGVQQVVECVQRPYKLERLEQLVREGNVGGTLIFVETRDAVDRLAALLAEANIPTALIHGEQPPRGHEWALSDFCAGRKPVLIVASAVARGLHIRNVHHVINFDLPRTVGDYVQRLSWTFRVTSFFEPFIDSRLAASLVQVLRETAQAAPDFLHVAVETERRAHFVEKDTSVQPALPCFD